MVKLTKGQVAVLVAASLPMAAAGIAGGIASYFNFVDVLASKSNAVSLVLAGEGATVICALVALAVTLMGQHTPAPARAGLWLIPLAASVAGVFVAPNLNTQIVMGLSPLAMTAAGEGVTLVARRIVAYRTGVDIEQQRRSGLLLWHANRAANGRGLAKKRSELAVWRLTKQFAATDTQMSVQLGEVQRYRIGEGADANLAAVLSGAGNVAQQPRTAPAVPAAPERPAIAPQAATEPHSDDEQDDDPQGHAWIQKLLDERDDADDEQDPTDGLLTADDVARQLNVKPGTVRSWVHRKKLAVAYRDTDGRAYFDQVAVDALT